MPGCGRASRITRGERAINNWLSTSAGSPIFCAQAAEALLLLGFEPGDWPVRSSLRRIGILIRQLEERDG